MAYVKYSEKNQVQEALDSYYKNIKWQHSQTFLCHSQALDIDSDSSRDHACVPRNDQFTGKIRWGPTSQAFIKTLNKLGPTIIHVTILNLINVLEMPKHNPKAISSWEITGVCF